MKRRQILSVLLAVTLSLFLVSGCAGSGQPGSSASTSSTSNAPSATSTSSQQTAVSADAPTIGLAWLSGVNESYFEMWEAIIREAGGNPVRLGQVRFNEDWYDQDGKLRAEFVNEDGALVAAAADKVKSIGWTSSNAQQVLDGIDAVIFPGGDDVSPTLYANPVPVLANEGFNPTRDVSDYLLMSYCIDQNKPTLCVCRGMQMLGVVSGASMIQDIPQYCEAAGIENLYAHRLQDFSSSDPQFAMHGVAVIDTGSFLYRSEGVNQLDPILSAHHQAVGDVQGTALKVVGLATTDNGLNSIEAIERTDKDYVVGIQFHPDRVVGPKLTEGTLTHGGNYEQSLAIFEGLVKAA